MSTLPPSREECVAAAGAVLAQATQDLMDLPARESALRAYVPGGPPVEELERRIRALLGLSDTTAPSAA